MEKLLYAHAEFVYSVVLCSRSFQQFLECRRGTEGSTKGHYTDWALAHHTCGNTSSYQAVKKQEPRRQAVPQHAPGAMQAIFICLVGSRARGHSSNVC
jgi:hypothetical protein